MREIGVSSSLTAKCELIHPDGIVGVADFFRDRNRGFALVNSLCITNPSVLREPTTKSAEDPFRCPPRVIEFGKANHVTAATASVAIEQALSGIHQEAWFMIGVQRTQSHHSATAEMSGRLPIMSLQIIQQRNLLF